MATKTVSTKTNAQRSHFSPQPTSQIFGTTRLNGTNQPASGTPTQFIKSTKSPQTKTGNPVLGRTGTGGTKTTSTTIAPIGTFIPIAGS